MDKGKDYISQMVQETFEGISDNVLEFRAPSNQMELNFNTLEVKLSKQRGCLAIHLKGKLLEIPVTWGPFKAFDIHRAEVDLRITRDDPSKLLFVLSNLFDQEINNIHIFGPQDDLRLTYEVSPSVAAA